MRYSRRETYVMPRGSRHDEAGWLNDDRGHLNLSRYAGGTERLDTPIARSRRMTVIPATVLLVPMGRWRPAQPSGSNIAV